MKITSSNLFTNTGALTVPFDDDITQTKANLETADFSEKYTSLGAAGTFSIQKTFAGANRFTCSYVAIAGHNFGDDAGSVTVHVNGDLKGTVSFANDTRNNVLFVTFAAVSLTDTILITYTKGTATNQMTVTFVAAGATFDVPNDGEQSGYSRVWLTTNVRQRVQENNEAGPILIATQRIAPTVTLTIANMGRTFAEGAWQGFLNFASSTPFFIKEQDAEPRSSYLCFDPVLFPPKAHSRTRELVTAALRFQAFTGT